LGYGSTAQKQRNGQFKTACSLGRDTLAVSKHTRRRNVGATTARQRVTKHGAANKGRDADTAPENMEKRIAHQGRQHVVLNVMEITPQGPKSVSKCEFRAPNNDGTTPNVTVEHLQVQGTNGSPDKRRQDATPRHSLDPGTSRLVESHAGSPPRMALSKRWFTPDLKRQQKAHNKLRRSWHAPSGERMTRSPLTSLEPCRRAKGNGQKR
jgi:hypothetical protein